MNDTRFFVLETGPDSSTYGVLRYHEDDNSLMLARFDKDTKQWVDDPKLFDHFRDGAVDIRQITPAKAAEIVKPWGGTL